jgi:hypothetical protein
MLSETDRSLTRRACRLSAPPAPSVERLHPLASEIEQVRHRREHPPRPPVRPHTALKYGFGLASREQHLRAPLVDTRSCCTNWRNRLGPRVVGAIEVNCGTEGAVSHSSAFHGRHSWWRPTVNGWTAVGVVCATASVPGGSEAAPALCLRFRLGSEVPRGRVRPNLELRAVLCPGSQGRGADFGMGLVPD